MVTAGPYLSTNQATRLCCAPPQAAWTTPALGEPLPGSGFSVWMNYNSQCFSWGNLHSGLEHVGDVNSIKNNTERQIRPGVMGGVRGSQEKDRVL